MSNLRTLIGSLLLTACLLIGGWLIWRCLAPATASAVTPLTPLNLTADELPTNEGLAILGAIYDDPSAQFELPVPRPDSASVGKQNLFQ